MIRKSLFAAGPVCATRCVCFYHTRYDLKEVNLGKSKSKKHFFRKVIVGVTEKYLTTFAPDRDDKSTVNERETERGRERQTDR